MRRIGTRKVKIEYVALGSSLFLFMLLFLASIHGLPRIFASSEVPVTLDVGLVLSLAVTPEDGLAIPVSPNVAGVYSTRSLTASVATNNLTGFTLTFSAGEGGTALINSANNETNTLPATSGTVGSPTYIDANRWGFAVPKAQAYPSGLIPNETNGFDNYYSMVTSVSALTETYATLPTYDLPLTLKSTDVLNGGANDDTDVYLGAHVNTAIPSGSYRGTVVFSVVGNYVAPEVRNMQDVANDEKLNELMPLDEEGNPVYAELRDSRDGEVYQIVRYGEYTYFMAEDLRLGSTTDPITLTPKNTNVTSNWTLPAAMSVGTTSSASSAQWIPASASGNAYCNANECGNLYNFVAATAGTNEQHDQFGGTNESICPAGWELMNYDFTIGITASQDLFDLSSAPLLDRPFSATLSGVYNSGFSGQGTKAVYWVSYVGWFDEPWGYDPSFAYFMSIDDATDTVIVPWHGLAPAGAENAYAVRCAYNAEQPTVE